MVSAVPAGEVMARDDVLGIFSPCAATIGTTIIEVRLPGMPPMQCLSTIMSPFHDSRPPTDAIARVSDRTSAAVVKRALAIRKAAISIFE